MRWFFVLTGSARLRFHFDASSPTKHTEGKKAHNPSDFFPKHFLVTCQEHMSPCGRGRVCASDIGKDVATYQNRKPTHVKVHFFSGKVLTTYKVWCN
jgi:hypothetical protein